MPHGSRHSSLGQGCKRHTTAAARDDARNQKRRRPALERGAAAAPVKAAIKDGLTPTTLTFDRAPAADSKPRSITAVNEREAVVWRPLFGAHEDFSSSQFEQIAVIQEIIGADEFLGHGEAMLAE